jgi:hypothetical protein
MTIMSFENAPLNQKNMFKLGFVTQKLKVDNFDKSWMRNFIQACE